MPRAVRAMYEAQAAEIATEMMWLIITGLGVVLAFAVGVLLAERNRRVRRAPSHDAICAVCRNPLRLQWVLDFDGLDDGPGVTEIWRHDFQPVHAHEPVAIRSRTRA